VADVKHRVGKTGELVFVEADRVLTQDGRERVAEARPLSIGALARRRRRFSPSICPNGLARRSGGQAQWT
jgi:hypothetical protein